MKKNDNILKYVERYKYKYGISYAQDGGRLVNTLSTISYLVWIYTFFMTTIFILSTSLMLKIGQAEFDYIANSFITICSGAVFMIIGAVLYLCRQKVFGCAVVAVAQPAMFMAYFHITRNSAGFLNPSFYWRHAVPAAILFCLVVWIFAILIMAKIKTNKLYNKLVDGLYKQYGRKDGDNLSETEWEEFLTNYNPYKPVM